MVKRSMTGSEETVAASDDSSICTMDGLEMVSMRSGCPSPLKGRKGESSIDRSQANGSRSHLATVDEPYCFQSPVVVHFEGDGYTVAPTSVRKAMYWKRNGGPLLSEASSQMAPLAMMERLSSERSASLDAEGVSLLMDEAEPQVIVVPNSPTRTYSTESGPTVSCDSLLSVREKRPPAVARVLAQASVTQTGDPLGASGVPMPDGSLTQASVTVAADVDNISSSVATQSKPPLVRIATATSVPRSPDAKRAAMLTAIQKMASAAAQGALPINPNAGPAWLNIDVMSVDDLCASYGVCDTCEQCDENGDKVTVVAIAERYCNVHYNSSGYVGAIAKTVNAVRGRSYSVINFHLLYLLYLLYLSSIGLQLPLANLHFLLKVLCIDHHPSNINLHTPNIDCHILNIDTLHFSYLG